MRIVLCGQGAFGAAVFDLLRAGGHELACAWSPEKDRLRDRALLFDVAWRAAGTLTAEALPGDVDLIVAAHSHDFVGRRTRLKSRLGALGYHPSLLPLHRGRDAVRWAVRAHERVTGGTAYWLSDVTDGGPVAAQEWCFVRPEDTARTLWQRALFPIGLRLIEKCLRDLGAGRLVAVPQDESLATWEPAFAQPPLRRPDLPQIGPGRLNGVDVLTDRLHLY